MPNVALSTVLPQKLELAFRTLAIQTLVYRQVAIPSSPAVPAIGATLAIKPHLLAKRRSHWLRLLFSCPR